MSSSRLQRSQSGNIPSSFLSIYVGHDVCKSLDYLFLLSQGIFFFSFGIFCWNAVSVLLFQFCLRFLLLFVVNFCSSTVCLCPCNKLWVGWTWKNIIVRLRVCLTVHPTYWEGASCPVDSSMFLLFFFMVGVALDCSFLLHFVVCCFETLMSLLHGCWFR